MNRLVSLFWMDIRFVFAKWIACSPFRIWPSLTRLSLSSCTQSIRNTWFYLSLYLTSTISLYRSSSSRNEPNTPMSISEESSLLRKIDRGKGGRYVHACSRSFKWKNTKGDANNIVRYGMEKFDLISGLFNRFGCRLRFT